MTFSVEDLRELLSEISRIKTKERLREYLDAIRPNFVDKSIQELKDELLKQTIEYVYGNCPYYKNLFDKVGVTTDDINKVQDLQKIPILTKEEVRKNVTDIISRRAMIIEMHATAGTTGERFPVYLTKEELESRALLTAIMSFLNLDRQAPIVILQVPAFYHAPVVTPVHVAISPMIINVPCFYTPEVRPSFNWITTEILRVHDLPTGKSQVSVIVAAPYRIRILTKEMIKRGMDAKSSAVRTIVTMGFYASQFLRDIIKKHWNAEVYDNYSLAEVSALASECYVHSGIRHFSVSAIPEVLNPITGEPVEYGEEGILVLTSLYPFQEAEPLIRYWTGDIVTLTDEKCPCGYRGVSLEKFIGRIEYCIDLSDMLPPTFHKRFFAPTDVLDVLDTIPETTFHPDMDVAFIRELQGPLYTPRFFMKRTDYNKKTEIGIVAELREGTGVKEKQKIAEKMKSYLHNTYNEWSDLLGSDKLRLGVKFVEPGGLGEEYFKV